MRVLVADRQSLTRMGLRAVLANAWGQIAFDEAGCLSELTGMLAQSRSYDLVLADLSIFRPEERHSLDALCERFAGVKIVVMSAFDDRSKILAALTAGARGFIPKSLRAKQIVSALELVLNGSIFVPDSLGQRVREPTPDRSEVCASSAMTPRQRAVFGELVKGKSSKQIAHALGISEGTVKIHLAAIYRVLGVKSRAQAIAKCAPGPLALAG